VFIFALAVSSQHNLTYTGIVGFNSKAITYLLYLQMLLSIAICRNFSERSIAVKFRIRSQKLAIPLYSTTGAGKMVESPKWSYPGHLPYDAIGD